MKKRENGFLEHCFIDRLTHHMILATNRCCIRIIPLSRGMKANTTRFESFVVKCKTSAGPQSLRDQWPALQLVLTSPRSFFFPHHFNLITPRELTTKLIRSHFFFANFRLCLLLLYTCLLLLLLLLLSLLLDCELKVLVQ